MILDDISNIGLYTSIIPRLAQAIDFIRRGDFSSIPDGRFTIDGDRIFANIETYATKDVNLRLFEAHRRYADVQFILGGDGERCGWAAGAQSLETTVPYDVAKDILFCAPRQVEWFSLLPGRFAIFLPEDAHEPSRHLNGAAANVRKCIVKLMLD